MSNSRDRSTAAIRQLLAPFNPTVFMDDYWEKRALHVARSMPEWCGELPGVSDIDELISHAGAKDVRLVRTEHAAGKETEIACKSDGRPNLFAAYRAYGEGWTVVINAVHAKAPRVGRLAAELEESVSHRVGVNLYFTPPGAQGFAPHADGHDVFVLQVSGRKRWRVFGSSIPLPLEEQKVPVNRKHPGRCSIEAILEPGHLLYIPRGYIHAGVADSEASVHLTIGIHPVRWMDLISEVVAIASERDLTLRCSVPQRELSAVPPAAEFRRKLNAVLSAIKEPKVIQEACLRLRQRRVHAAPPALDGHFVAIDCARSINLRTVVQHRPGIDGLVRLENDRAVLEFGGNRMEGPAAIKPSLQFVLRNRQFSVADMPNDLTDGSKLVLVRKLVTEGLLTLDRSIKSKGDTPWQKRKRPRQRRRP